MTKLDADVIRGALADLTSLRIAAFEIFDQIESTNSYLLGKAPPPPGQISIALTENQTAGRGRHGKTWQSPPGSGICLSASYTFAARPTDLPALTLAVGMGVADALDKVGAAGIQLKWPNDLMANDGKLGGILTESQMLAGAAVTVVSGVGLNVDFGHSAESRPSVDSGRRIADLAELVALPPRNELAARLVDGLCATFVAYEASGFSSYARRWPGRDWLQGRELTVESPQCRVTGVGAGVAEDGALLVDTGSGAVTRVTSGTVQARVAEEGGA